MPRNGLNATVKNTYGLFPSFFFNNLNCKPNTKICCGLYTKYSNIYFFALKSIGESLSSKNICRQEYRSPSKTHHFL